MAVNLMPPPRTAGSADIRLDRLYSYLYQLTEALNIALGKLEGRIAAADSDDKESGTAILYQANRIAAGTGAANRIITGKVDIVPSANAVTSIDVVFPEPLEAAPDVVLVSPIADAPYADIMYACASDYLATGFRLHLYSSSGEACAVAWLAAYQSKNS